MKLWRVLLILAAGVTLGLLWNGMSGRGFALSMNVFLKEGDEVVDVAEAKRLLDRGALFLDARAVAFHEMGHIPGALPLSESDFEKAFVGLEPTLRSRFDIVVYCSGYGCEASHIVARKLKDKGIPAAVFADGMPAWEEAQHPIRSGKEP